MNGPRLKMPLVMVLALVLHTSVLSYFRPAGVAPDLMLLLAIVVGIVGGPSRGAVLGFTSGLALDLFLQTPLGLSALVFSLVGYGVGSVQSGILRSSWWIPLATAFGASVMGEVLYAVSAAVVGHPQLLNLNLLLIVAVVGALNAVLSPVALRVVSWALRSPYATPSYR